MARLMSDAEIRRRKKLQGHISQTTGTLGLASLGAYTASKIPGAKVLTKTPRLRRLGASRAINAINPKKAEGAALGLSTAGAGIGGAGSYNFAAYTGAESRKRKMQPVKKELGMEMGYYGEEGRPIKLPEIKVPIEKAWSPSASNYNPEVSRRKRNQVTEVAAAGAAGGLGGASARRLHQGITLKGQAVQREMKGKSGLKARRLASSRLKSGKLLGAAAAGATGAAAFTHHGRRSKSWQGYSKRDQVSAFGVDHTD